jgi:hypothetical protein
MGSWSRLKRPCSWFLPVSLCFETARIMTVKQKIFYSVLLAIIALLITFPDVLFEFAVEFTHSLLEMVIESFHAIFEIVETVLDDSVEAVFHTGLHTTQILVFYIMFLIAIGLIYGLVKVLLKLWHYVKAKFFAFWLQQQYMFSVYWTNLSLASKIKVVTLISGIAYLFFMVSF